MKLGVAIVRFWVELLTAVLAISSGTHSINSFAMYKKDSPHKASPNSGCPPTAISRPQTLSSITGIINIIVLPPLLETLTFVQSH